MTQTRYNATMKVTRALAACLVLSSAIAWGAVPPARSLLKSAEIKAGHEHKNVLLIFHASWCGWCHKMDDLLNSAQFKPAFDHSYVIVHITVLEDKAHLADENPGGADLLSELHGAGEGIPYYVVFNPRGEALADSRNPKNIGYPSEPAEVDFFMSIMKKTSHMSATELSDLQSYLGKKGG